MSMALSPESFIQERLEQYRSWYDKKAVIAKSRYLAMRVFSVSAGVAVPVLVNIPQDFSILGISLLKTTITIVSVLVAIAVSLESVLHYREQWKNYRSTEQMLMHERIAFQCGTSVYEGLDADRAFKLFVERVEEAIRAENAATLNVMTMVNEPAEKPRS